MTAFVTYCSLTGHSTTVADAIAENLGDEADPILEQSARSGLLGTAAGTVNALRGRKSAIAEPVRDTSALDLAILGTPVWVGAPTPAVNAYIDRHHDAFDHMVFF